MQDCKTIFKNNSAVDKLGVTLEELKKINSVPKNSFSNSLYGFSEKIIRHSKCKKCLFK